MAVWWLARQLVKEVPVAIKELETGKTLWTGTAGQASFSDKVEDWDFSEKVHVIFI